MNFDIYPNPLSGKSFNLIFKGAGNQELEIVIYDINGRQIYSQLIAAEEQENVYEINPVVKPDNGIYFIRVTDSSQNSYSKKLIIQD